MAGKRKRTKPLTSKDLETVLWETVIKAKSGEIDKDTSNAINKNVRGILAVKKLEIEVTKQARRKPTPKLTKFTGL